MVYWNLRIDSHVFDYVQAKLSKARSTPVKGLNSHDKKHLRDSRSSSVGSLYPCRHYSNEYACTMGYNGASILPVPCSSRAYENIYLEERFLRFDCCTVAGPWWEIIKGYGVEVGSYPYRGDSQVFSPFGQHLPWQAMIELALLLQKQHQNMENSGPCFHNHSCTLPPAKPTIDNCLPS